MEESQGKGGSAAATGSSGESTQPNTEENKEPSGKKFVPLDVHKKTLDELHTGRAKLQDLEAKMNATEEERLKEKDNFKQLWERDKAELDKERGLRKKQEETIVRAQKFSALERDARAMGLRDEASEDLELLDLSSIQLETTDRGRYVVHGTKEYLEELKTKRPHWFKNTKPPTVNSGGGSSKPDGNGAVNASDVNAAERAWRSGKSTKEAYEATFQKYVAQGKKT